MTKVLGAFAVEYNVPVRTNFACLFEAGVSDCGAAPDGVRRFAVRPDDLLGSCAPAESGNGNDREKVFHVSSTR